MYKLRAPLIYSDDENIIIIKKLFKEVLGYTDKEIQQFVDTNFLREVAINLTLEQAEKIAKPFFDNGIDLYIRSQQTNEFLGWESDLGVYIVEESPKDHYYDEPVVSREHLVNPFEAKQIQKIQESCPISEIKKNIVTCPYCQSTKCSRISILGRMVSVEFWGLASNKLGKQWHCHDCGSNF